MLFPVWHAVDSLLRERFCLIILYQIILYLFNVGEVPRPLTWWRSTIWCWWKSMRNVGIEIHGVLFRVFVYERSCFLCSSWQRPGQIRALTTLFLLNTFQTFETFFTCHFLHVNLTSWRENKRRRERGNGVIELVFMGTISVLIFCTTSTMVSD